MRWLFKVLTAWGRHTLKKKDMFEDTYEPRSKGKWVNKGKGYNEKWEWEEKIVDLPTTYWVNVFKSGPSVYAIVVAKDKSEFALEYVDCSNLKEVGRATSMYRAYYSCFGTVTVDNEYTEEDSIP
ncbi:hypothetical protein D3C75_789410 [compost metagenome]